jgi:RimJ/RimL family protein N-acetyltransferase
MSESFEEGSETKVFSPETTVSDKGVEKDMRVEGRNIYFRLADISDARFILDLRNNRSLNKFLSAVKDDLYAQEQWLNKYKKREIEGKEYYFIIENKNSEPVGTVRLYDFRNDSFCWGSWILNTGAPNSAAIESALMVYETAFYRLGFTKSHFEVRKNNEKVIAFHKRFGALVSHEDDINYYFIFSNDTYETTKCRYAKFLSVRNNGRTDHENCTV